MSGERRAESRKVRAWWIILFIPVIFAGCSKTAIVSKPKGPVLTVSKTTAVPKIDGSATEAAWGRAAPVKIKTRNGPEVTMKAVYTDSDVYFTASWPDATKNDIQRIWTYSNGAWKGGSPDDSFAVMWNKNGSLRGFDSSGCEPLCHKPTDDPATWSMEITGSSDSADLWPGRNQTGDMWDLSLAISNVIGTVSDYNFSIDPAYTKSPKLIRPRIFRQNDSFSDSAPWRRNVIAGGAIDSAPAYMYKQGFSFETTPYPTDAQMIKILPGAVFSEGDKLPFIIFADNYVNWTGSKGDLKGKGVWKNGIWTVEIARKLDTREPDDVAFQPSSGDSYKFALAIFNATIIGHTTSLPVNLVFSK